MTHDRWYVHLMCLISTMKRMRCPVIEIKMKNIIIGIKTLVKPVSEIIKKMFQVDVDVVLKVLRWNYGEGQHLVFKCSIWNVLFLLTNFQTNPGHWVDMCKGLVTPAGIVVQLMESKLATYFRHQKLKRFPASNIMTRTKFQSILKTTPGRSQKSSRHFFLVLSLTMDRPLPVKAGVGVLCWSRWRHKKMGVAWREPHRWQAGWPVGRVQRGWTDPSAQQQGELETRCVLLPQRRLLHL